MAGIQNQEALVNVFGYWPSFHDAKLLSVRLNSDAEHYGSLEADIHVFEMTNQIDDKGYFVLDHHRVVCLRFRGLADLELSDFQGGNILFGLQIEDIEVTGNQTCSFAVTFDASIGCEMSFKCQEVAVLSVEPYNAGS